MPFGLKCAPATFQRTIMRAFEEFLNKFLQVFLDDFTVYRTKHIHIEHLRKCLKRCRKVDISLNPEKCTFAISSSTLLGHVICKDGILVDPTKIKAIQTLPPPRTLKGVRQVMGSASYYRRFVKDFAKITSPLANLTKSSVKLVWDDKCQAAFDLIKQKLITTPTLITLDWNEEFHVHCDASNEAIGSVLAQNVHGNIDSPIYYASQLLNSAERNYTTTEREALAMIDFLHKFRHYLLANHFIIYVDHGALLHLVNRPVVSGRIARWMLLLQEYNFEIIHRPGRQYMVADHLTE